MWHDFEKNLGMPGFFRILLRLDEKPCLSFIESLFVLASWHVLGSFLNKGRFHEKKVAVLLDFVQMRWGVGGSLRTTCVLCCVLKERLRKVKGRVKAVPWCWEVLWRLANAATFSTKYVLTEEVFFNRSRIFLLKQNRLLAGLVGERDNLNKIVWGFGRLWLLIFFSKIIRVHLMVRNVLSLEQFQLFNLTNVKNFVPSCKLS